LFVTSADSPHAQSWAALLKGANFDVRLFSVPLLADPPHAVEWQFPTYVTVQPQANGTKVAGVRWLLPVLPHTRSLVTWAEGRFSISSRWLRRTIRVWRPHIVHSLPLDTGGKLARSAFESMPIETRPRWVASSWGSDLCIGLLDPNRRPNIEFILKHCDGFMADCRHDLELAERAGQAPSKRALPDGAPGNGGVDVERFAHLRQTAARRNVILIPKAFEREHANRTFTVIEALRLLGDRLENYEVHLLMCSAGVRTWLAQMPEGLQRRCQCHGTLPQHEFFEMLSRTRVMVSPSLSDGTPNVMLEAMAAGALPLISPLPSISEWIEHGQNGLMAHALYPDQIAGELSRALIDDELFERASSRNWDLVCQRADRKKIARQIVEYYERLAS
jgi:glycosyltransferase involved in cell wall biosynthesis